MRRLIVFLVSAAFCQVNPPALPFYDWGACPGEGCVYREWTARTNTIVYDTWKPTRRTVAQLEKGDKVVAATGVVITFKPGMIKTSDGEPILTYAYRGEGYSAAWFKGRYYQDFDISFLSQHPESEVDKGRKEWWAEVKLKSGRSGWVNMQTAEFDGVCVAQAASLHQDVVGS
jgi:hypothetical protein